MKTEGGLAIKLIQSGGSPGAPTFRVVMENVGLEGLAVPIGFTRDRGRQQYLTGLRYFLRQPSGEVVELTPRLPASSFGNPASDPVEIPLGPGAAISLPVNFAALWMTQVGPDWRVHLSPGRYTLWIELEHRMTVPGMKGNCILPRPMVPYWIGNLKTEPLSFVVPR